MFRIFLGIVLLMGFVAPIRAEEDTRICHDSTYSAQSSRFLTEMQYAMERVIELTDGVPSILDPGWEEEIAGRIEEFLAIHRTIRILGLSLVKTTRCDALARLYEEFTTWLNAQERPFYADSPADPDRWNGDCLWRLYLAIVAENWGMTAPEDAQTWRDHCAMPHVPVVIPSRG